MSTRPQRTHVDSREIDQWVQAIVTCHDTDRADLNGGIAPREIRKITGTQRARGTIKDHLRTDERVVEAKGFCVSLGSRRSSFLPRGDLR